MRSEECMWHEAWGMRSAWGHTTSPWMQGPIDTLHALALLLRPHPLFYSWAAIFMCARAAIFMCAWAAIFMCAWAGIFMCGSDSARIYFREWQSRRMRITLGATNPRHGVSLPAPLNLWRGRNPFWGQRWSWDIASYSAKILYVAERVRIDKESEIYFLCTRVAHSTDQN